MPRIHADERAALIRARIDGVRRTARDQVVRAEQQVQQAEAIATRLVDSELAAEAARQADLERGGLLALARDRRGSVDKALALLASPGELASYFRPRAEGGRVRLERVNADPKELGNGDTVLVPAGRSALKASLLGAAAREAAFPYDLTFEGAGMDRSLLVLDRSLDIDKSVVNLTFRDMTVDCNNNPFVQLRGGFTLFLERCRIVGFDRSAGGVEAIGGSEGVVYARDCRFELGFGPHTWNGDLWRVDDVLLARLEGCTIVGPMREVRPRGQGLVVCERVTFVDLEQRQREELGRHQAGIKLVSCRFESNDPPFGRDRPRRSLADISSAWAEDR
ncbi:MAG: hypothetical protein R3F05_20605 [Planctomycetota bacterium]